jgi:integrating conjugative element protein (TIGR03759 family)
MKHSGDTGLVALFLCVTVSVFAAETSGERRSVVQNSPAMQTPVEPLAQRAGAWGLSPEELLRYQALMAGPRGFQSPGLDPLSTLGIEARSEAERRQYAEQWVQTEFARTGKELRFQQEVNAAWRRLYSQVRAVNLRHVDGITGDAGGRLALFVRAKGCASCDARLAAVLASARPVDLYLVDSQGDDGVLRQWARDHRIPAARVRRREVTLNHGGGLWMRVGNGLIPLVLQQGGDGWHIVAF